MKPFLFVGIFLSCLAPVSLFAATTPSTPAYHGASSSCDLPVTDTYRRLREAILLLVNRERAKEKLAALTLNSCLSAAAQRHAVYMAKTQDFNHTTTAGQTMADRLSAVGFRKTWTAENIAWGQKNVIEVVQDWMKSPGHRANILNPKLTKLGVGFADYYWVQDFAGGK